ncbi:divalent-cation tolerance protein CutA [Streptomyces sp. NPDC054932]
MVSIVIAQTSADDEQKAYDIARGAVEARLTARADVEARMTAFYRWKGTVRHEREYRVSFQTTTEKVAELEAWVHEQQPHEVPQWIVLPGARASEECLAWAVQETTAQ